MNPFITTFLAVALTTQCSTCPKSSLPAIARSKQVSEEHQQTVGEQNLPYEFILSRSADDFVPMLSGATFAIATLTENKLDLELVFRVGKRLSYSKLTDDAPIDFRPVWMPDGQSLLFDSNRNKKVGIWKLALSENEPQSLIQPEEGGMCFGASPSPDGKYVAYTKTNFVDVAWWTNYVIPNISGISPEQFQIVIRDIDDGADRILTYGMLPTWSPDGSKIAYSLFDGASWSLWVADAKSGQRYQLTNTAQSDLCATWSPDGNWLAFCRIDHQMKTSDIWAVRADGSISIQLTKTADRSEGGPCWTPDGIYIHTDAGEGTPYDIALIAKVKLPTTTTTSEVQHTITAKEHLTIQVLNSTNIPKLAARTAELLKKNGYKIADVRNSKRERYLKKGKIYYKSGLKKYAKEIAQIIPGTQLLKQSKSFRYDIVIVLGKNTRY